MKENRQPFPPTEKQMILANQKYNTFPAKAQVISNCLLKVSRIFKIHLSFRNEDFGYTDFDGYNVSSTSKNWLLPARRPLSI